MPPLPEKIGKYEILSELGRGAMGTVYKARDPVLDREVAIKTMSEELLADQEMRERFFREAKSAAQLQHINIVTIYELGKIEVGDGVEKPFIAMELLEGYRSRRSRRSATAHAPRGQDRSGGPDVPRPRLRSQARGHPSRRQAGKRSGSPRRHREDPRFRHRLAERLHDEDKDRFGDGDAYVHGSGADQRRAGGPTEPICGRGAAFSTSC